MKDNDKGIKSALSNARSIASIYLYDHEGDYTGVCGKDINDRNLIGGVFKGLYTKVNEVVCNDSEKGYAMSAKLASPNTGYWCVDSSGIAKETKKTLSLGVYVCEKNTTSQ